MPKELCMQPPNDQYDIISWKDFKLHSYGNLAYLVIKQQLKNFVGIPSLPREKPNEHGLEVDWSFPSLYGNS